MSDRKSLLYESIPAKIYFFSISFNLVCHEIYKPLFMLLVIAKFVPKMCENKHIQGVIKYKYN